MNDDSARAILEVIQAINRGDFTRKVGGNPVGVEGQIAEEVNALVDRLNEYAQESTTLMRDTSDSRYGGQIEILDAEGTWQDLVTNLNTMSKDLTTHFRATALIVTALANGDFDRTMTLPCKGEMEELRLTLNEMGRQMAQFKSELSRVAQEVGVEGRFGCQAEVQGLSGDWRELVDNINLMARNLTDQVRDMSRVTHALVSGDPSLRASAPASGETRELREALNVLADRVSGTA